MPLKGRLAQKVDLRIPHFLRSVPEGGVLQQAFSDEPTGTWYERFRDNVYDRLGRGFFPIFRFGDGECVFSVGYRMGAPPPGVSAVRHYAKTFLSAYVKHRLQWNFRSGSANYGYELYNRREWREARPRFVAYLREIAREGYVSFNFVTQFGIPFCDRYMEPVCDWLDANSIDITPQNYLPVYFVYALFLGPDRHRILQGRRVLVVTSLDDRKEALLKTGLLREGVADVEFRRISRSKSMLDRVDVSNLALPVDLVLIGAGVGAANIIHQVRSLGVLTVDAGYIIDCYAEPERKGSRVFTRPDDELTRSPEQT